MRKTIRPGRSAYLSLGVILLGLIIFWGFIWVARGPQTNAWGPIALLAGIFVFWCLALSRRRIIIDEYGIICTYLIRGPHQTAWRDIQRSEVVYWIDKKPYQIFVFGDSLDKPILSIPLRLYDPPDVDYLINLMELRAVNKAAKY